MDRRPFTVHGMRALSRVSPPAHRGAPAMPFDYVQTVLGLSFVLAWVFIGGMMMRDSLDEARRHRFDKPSDDPLAGNAPHNRQSQVSP